MRTICCLLSFLCVCQISLSEMPQQPNDEELCEGSELVVRGTYVSCLTQEIKLNNRVYCEYVFDIQKYYKGKTGTRSLTVLMPTDHATGIIAGDCIFPAYQKGEDYFLFLQKHNKRLTIRTRIDDVWGERPYTLQGERAIENEIREQNIPDRWRIKGDNLTYKIRDDAIEEEVTLSETQRERYLKILRYRKDNELVGERGWYLNGQIAYEEPYKAGLRHGIAKEWREDGSLYRLCCYRKDRGHGYLLQWSNSNLDMTFRVRGEAVSREQYVKECKKNLTLPKIKLD